MIVFVNGERVECEEARTVAELILGYQLQPETTLVEHNGTALRPGEWSNNVLQENDRIEILSVSAGG